MSSRRYSRCTGRHRANSSRLGVGSRRWGQFQYRRTESPRPPWTHAHWVADELSAREQALRRLPLPYSLALRLRDAGVAPEVVCEYVAVEKDSLDGVYRVAEAKLLAQQQKRNDQDGKRREPTVPTRSDLP
jgi:hypothetical protein